jgi:hypothetical protein
MEGNVSFHLFHSKGLSSQRSENKGLSGGLPGRNGGFQQVAASNASATAKAKNALQVSPLRRQSAPPPVEMTEFWVVPLIIESGA